MVSPREGSQGWRLALWAGLAVGWLLPSAGCQVEYAGMTLPSGKYLHDDVQYFPPGPEFPWANTQAATQRARMQAMGIDTGLGPLPGQPGAAPAATPPPAPGALDPTQNVPNQPTNVNQSPAVREPVMPEPGAPVPGVPGNAPAPGVSPAPVPPPGF